MAFYPNSLTSMFPFWAISPHLRRKQIQSTAAFMVFSQSFLAIGCPRLAYPEGQRYLGEVLVL